MQAMDRVDPRKTGGDSENNDMTVSCLLAVGRAMVQRMPPHFFNFPYMSHAPLSDQMYCWQIVSKYEDLGDLRACKAWAHTEMHPQFMFLI